MSHLHDKLASAEKPRLYVVTDPEGHISARLLYLAEVDTLVYAGYTVKEMRMKG